VHPGDINNMGLQRATGEFSRQMVNSASQQGNSHDTGMPVGMNILWVKVGGLWPVNTGGRIRSFHIISELSRRNRVTVLTTHMPGENSDELRRQLPLCERVDSYSYAPPKVRSKHFLWALFRSWFSALPVDLWKARVPALRNEVSLLLEKEKFDICVADFLFAVPNIPFGGEVPLVFFAHNVEYMIWKRLCENDTSLLRSLLLSIEWRKVRRYENKACRIADLIVAVSPEDRDLLTANIPESNACAISTGVDIDYFRPMGTAEVQAELVFTGSMDWHPNEDAILYFIKEILPLIRKDHPMVSLTVVGRNPSLQLIKEAFKYGVRVSGTVSDIRPYVANAAVYIVPLRIGGGTRLKIFEALAMGKAVVSTRVGAEGLPLENGKHFMCADEPEHFAQAVVSLLQDPGRRREMGAAGRELVAGHYSWEQVSREFEEDCRNLITQSNAA